MRAPSLSSKANLFRGFVMSEYLPLPSLEHLKQQAKRLRAQIAADGNAIGHSRSLELLAHQYGYRDWNTLHAAVGNRPPGAPLTLGGRVEGRYLGKPFSGTVLAIRTLGHSDRHRVTIHFDEPVDVIEFDSWSAFRQRVTSNLCESGRTIERTSNGMPVMELDL